MVKKYELFEVRPNVEALKAFREEYIKTFQGNPLCKILSRTDKWYRSKNGLYTPSVLSLGIAPLSKKEMDLKTKKKIIDIDSFVRYGASNVQQVRAINVSAEPGVRIYKSTPRYFYLFEAPSMINRINGFSTPALELNQDLYNMFMIQFRRFGATTTPDDLSRYSDYFSVIDENPSKFKFSDSLIEDFYKCSIMSEQDINMLFKNLEIEEQAVRSLRKK